jgi:glycosyltransferase involved in cell wall biosynthesis
MSTAESKNPIKVLYLIDSGGLYGAEKMLLSLVSEQVRQGLDPLILSVGTIHQGEKALETEANRLRLPVKSWRMNSGFNFFGMLAILKFAKTEGFNLYHSHGYKFNVLLGLMPKTLRGAPVLSTIHGYVLPPRFSKMRAYLFLDRVCLPRLDNIIFVNSLMLQQPFFKSLKLQNSYVVVNGINPDVSFNVTDLSEGDLKVRAIGNAGTVIGYIGRLSREKGIVYLIYAFQQLLADKPEALLLICGDGPLKAELLEKVDRLGIADKVFFVGFISDVQSALEKMDVFVIPSLTEGMPIVLLEAMALGKPIIATKVGGMPQMLDDGLAGMIVDSENVEAIVRSTNIFLSDSFEAGAMTKAAKAKFFSSYSSSKMAESYLARYQELAS